MHTPDGIITSWICVMMLAVSAVVIAVSLMRLHLSKRQILTFCGLTSVAFLLQMLNITILPGISGHLIGTGIIVMLLGVPAGIVSLAIILFVQVIFFGDGGILAYGINLFGMGIMASLSVALVKHRLGTGPKAYFLSGISSVMAAVLSLNFFLTISGKPDLVLPLFLFHLPTSLLEGTVFLAIFLTHKHLMAFSFKEWSLAIAALSCIIPLASSLPDALIHTLEISTIGYLTMPSLIPPAFMAGTSLIFIAFISSLIIFGMSALIPQRA
ncbi:MAG: energy-coupling factor ABC transporter permease [Nanoarchaeota archaeon]